MFSSNPAKSVAKLTCLVSLFAFPLSFSLRAQPPAQPPGSHQLLASVSILDSNREQDGLFGPVRRVRAETAKLSLQAGRVAEGPRVLLEMTTYAPQGQRVENTSYPVADAASAPTGREEYKYDDKGNVMEKTLHDEAGNTLSKETYAYEFDSFDNWTKMTTSLVVFEANQLSSEPTEVTYRTISYYFDEAVAKKMQPAAPTTTTGAPVASPATKTAEGQPPAGTDRNAQPTNTSESASNKRPASVAPTALDLLTTSRLNVASPTAPVATNTAGNGELIKTSDPSPPAAGPAAKPDAKLVSGETIGAKAINLPKPIYPETAMKARLYGVVTVQAIIDPSGRVIEAEAISGPQWLKPAALEAAKRARFKPARIAGQPTRSTVTINFNFKEAR